MYSQGTIVLEIFMKLYLHFIYLCISHIGHSFTIINYICLIGKQLSGKVRETPEELLLESYFQFYVLILICHKLIPIIIFGGS